MMRQAGRSLPEYRELRAKNTMMQACFDADLITEITLQPVRRHDVDAAIRVRMRRQDILYDPGRRFHFLMPEAVLRYRLAPDDVMRGQLDRLLAVTTLPNVEFGLVPFGAELPSAPMNGFWIYNESLVGVATRTKELLLRDPEEVAFYAAAFEELRAASVFNEQARELIVRVLVEYSTQSAP